MVGGCGKLTVIHCMYVCICPSQDAFNKAPVNTWKVGTGAVRSVLHTMSCSTMGASSDSHASPYPTLLKNYCAIIAMRR